MESSSILLESSSILLDSTTSCNEECCPTKVEKSGQEELFRRMPPNKNGEARWVVMMICLEELVNSLATICNIQNTSPFENPC